MENENNQSVTSFIFKVVKPYQWYLVGQFIIALIAAIDLSLRPYVVKVILDKIPSISVLQVFSALLLPASAYLLLTILSTANARVYDWLWLTYYPHLKRNITNVLMQHLMQHSHSYFQNHFAGSLYTKLMNCVNYIPSLIKIIVDEFLYNVLTLIIAIYTVWHVNYKFALGLTTWALIFILVGIKVGPRLRQFAIQIADNNARTAGMLIDILANMVNVKLFNQQAQESTLVNNNSKNWAELYQRREWFLMKVYIFQGGSFAIFQGICLYWLITDLANKIVTAGDFALIFTINIAILNCLWNFSKEVRDFMESLGNISEGLQIIMSPLEIKDSSHAKELIIHSGSIVFDHVYFHYKYSDPLFNGLNLLIPAGQKVGLVGYSGSGKTTFINLLLRLYDIKMGRILIDEQNIREVTQTSLHQTIAVIPQDPALFNRSLLENIRYGCINASNEEVINAAKRAHAHEFIQALPNGYDSLVGERGVKLSGGQRQRIAIARAILKNAPILILDEATSHLDSITENFIQESIWDLMQNKTTLVIAHRLSTLLHMDRILVFERGKIVQDGTHKQLIASKGLYKKLWDAQVGGFLPISRQKEAG